MPREEVHVIRELDIQTTKNLKLIYSGKGTGATYGDVSIFGVDLALLPKNFFIIGQVAVPTNCSTVPPSSLVVVSPVNDIPAVKNPIDYELKWEDKGSGGDYDGSFWRVIPPKGYVALGDVVTGDYQKPGSEFTKKYACISEHLTRPGIFGAKPLWTDKGSGAPKDGAIWQSECSGKVDETGLAGLFKVNDNYGKPNFGCSVLSAGVFSF